MFVGAEARAGAIGDLWGSYWGYAGANTAAMGKGAGSAIYEIGALPVDAMMLAGNALGLASNAVLGTRPYQLPYFSNTFTGYLAEQDQRIAMGQPAGQLPSAGELGWSALNAGTLGIADMGSQLPGAWRSNDFSGVARSFGGTAVAAAGVFGGSTSVGTRSWRPAGPGGGQNLQVLAPRWGGVRGRWTPVIDSATQRPIPRGPALQGPVPRSLPMDPSMRGEQVPLHGVAERAQALRSNFEWGDPTYFTAPATRIFRRLGLDTPMWVWRMRARRDPGNVVYMTPRTAAEHRMLIDSTGVARNVYGQALADGTYSIVLDAEGGIYGRVGEVGRYHHSSFLAGGNVASAGELVIARGRLVFLTSKSGHYKPGPGYFLVTKALLEYRVGLKFGTTYQIPNTGFFGGIHAAEILPP